MRKLFISVVLATLAITLVGPAAQAAPPAGMHCADHNAAGTVKFEGAGTFHLDGVTITVKGSTVTFTDANGNPVVASFCVKASTKNSGLITASSYTVDFLNGGGQRPAISYVAVYDAGEPCIPDPYSGHYC